ncbi:MAG: tRNA (guanine-N(1)-)-methyltransferase [candidate division TM6 bacterium GW2011_GWF2_32_72]|nr:MAG: tRNA (guanine-N(1)-)-methyltransferase [candidate division TM6 bacterium GW2011_GWF2_32_72]
MKISILSVFPGIYENFLDTSLVKKAQEKELVKFNLVSFMDFSDTKRIDAPSFGHGAGMLLKPEVVKKSINFQENNHGKAFKIFFSPHGKKLDQKLLKNLAEKAIEQDHLILIAGRYEGMDARVEEEYADEIISIGDYVLMGGDLPAMVLLEGLLRFVPGIIGKQESVEHDSFSGPFVDYPEYTAPVEWHGQMVPEVLRSGNHAEIAKWRENQAVKRSVASHFDWVRSSEMSKSQENLVSSFIPNHYVALMHSDVMVNGVSGTSSVTSIDIHDISRSGATYGVKNFFIVTPLIDQKKIVETLLGFWKTGYGVDYNSNRHTAVKRAELVDTFQDVLNKIEETEGCKPLVIATSAKGTESKRLLTYFDQSVVWKEKRPVLFIFGTAQGLSQDLINKCDYLLGPVRGFSNFNHLSVRSAVAIILDRWLGINVK